MVKLKYFSFPLCIVEVLVGFLLASIVLVVSIHLTLASPLADNFNAIIAKINDYFKVLCLK